MATKKFFFSLGTFSIKDGSEIRFWEDNHPPSTYIYLVLQLTVIKQLGQLN
jgi:hypothetical protein